MWGKVNKNSRNADGLSPFLSLASKFYMAIGGIAPRITREFFFSCERPSIVTRFFFLVRTTLDCYGNFFFSCETPLIVTGNFFSRANDPRLLREIFFLVRNTLDCYGKFFFSCERPSIVTGNFFPVRTTLDYTKKGGISVAETLP